MIDGIVTFTENNHMIPLNNDPMNTDYQIQLHEKSLKILDMMQKLRSKISVQHEMLWQYKNAKDKYAPVRLFSSDNTIQAEINRLELVKSRLTEYYIKSLMKLIDHQINKAA